ncbi:divergent polysaccharide deacteylase family protein [Pseudooctadecabacter jejudonensis]|uniref:Divergent polysaccharide deacetylase n=1 Tax=Pseudooctadecabacter jejudonensis TaxID=1391910 RepID=A0A1Y5RAD4_9RHOB|nr:divergent polysaccharide deacteylase family protein [Pseudooctadecabacter jejudonensis]SLN12834.1 Divergent polysaccharide deacetylase [Pseudooctadecabacter jejudonensis]
MQGFLGGIVSGGLVSVLALSVASVVSEAPPGATPPALPLVQAPQVDVAPSPVAAADSAEPASTPVGSVSIEAPVTPDLPEGETASSTDTAPVPQTSQVAPQDTQSAPLADTAPLDAPEVVAIEGALAAPETPAGAGIEAEPVDPVFPNPQSLAPETPQTEADLTVSTAPAPQVVVIEPEVAPQDAPEQAAVEGAQEVSDADRTQVADGATGEVAAIAPDPSAEAPTADEDVFIVDLEANEGPTTDVSPAPEAADIAAAVQPAPRLQLQGDGNTLLADRATGVTVRRPGAVADTDARETATEDAAPVNALVDFAAPVPDDASGALMSIVLIDDGSMSAAAAALSGVPFPVTIALDPERADVTEAMEGYRANGFEVAVLAKVPEGAQPADVEVTLQSVFRSVPESLAVLDIGDGGLQSDRAVTQQAMEALAAQGRGFVTVSQGLNMAGRAAEQAGVPAATVYRDLDADDQDARVIRRFVDQAAFRARQNSGVVLVGRVRPDTLSALILWGTANDEDQVSLVPLSAVLMAQ